MVQEIVWTTAALAEFDEVVAYIRNQDPITATRVAARIDERVGSLLANPRLGRPGRVRGTRELVVAPFVVAYEIRDDLIVI
jgi:plasmid stabilization system protein ParE